MTDNEIAQRLRALPRRTPPAAWRREILAAVEAAAERPEPLGWWARLFQPRPFGWALLALTWLGIIVLQSPYRPPRPAHLAVPTDTKQLRELLLARQRLVPDFDSPTPSPPTSQRSAPHGRASHST
ncbi:MAG: hypothetical protein JSR82_18425 [Verrucomicrobia bacterium]|nr:hypothetical protein [Verrucomicrobiota bacterium]